eukprot:scaffold11885_cov129-Isochrysis_galbana.AAC.7
MQNVLEPARRRASHKGGSDAPSLFSPTGSGRVFDRATTNTLQHPLRPPLPPLFGGTAPALRYSRVPFNGRLLSPGFPCAAARATCAGVRRVDGWGLMPSRARRCT